MTIGIIGSRRRDTLMDFSLTKAAFDKLWAGGPDDRIVSGGCPQGGDKFAEVIACQLSRPGHYTERDLIWLLSISTAARHQLVTNLCAPISIYPALWNKYGRVAGFLRNSDIARDADILIACVAADRTGGTEDTIKKFLKKGKDNEGVVLV